MVIASTLRAKDIDDDSLRTLGTQIYTLLGETSLAIKCTLKNNRLVVLAEHSADTPLDTVPILDRLERNIQALQLQFTQKVRLYLRHLGERQPYAYRQFVLAPPPPPFSKRALSRSPLEQPWIVGDAELDALVNQLTSLDPLENWDVESADGHLVLPMGAEDIHPDAVQDEGSGLLEDGLIPNAVDLQLDGPDLSPIACGESDVLLTASHPSLASALVPTDPPPAWSEDSAYQGQSLLSTPVSLATDRAHRDPASIVVSDVDLAGETLEQHGLHSFKYETSQRLKALSQALWHSTPSKDSLQKTDAQQLTATAQLENPGYRRVAIATVGLASLGVVVGLYGATRPCVIGGCLAIAEADHWGEKSQRMMQQAQTWADVEAVIPPLNQALDILEPIPVWSSHATTVEDRREIYTIYLGQINQLLDVEEAVNHANQLSRQTVYSFEDLQTVRSLWKSAIDDLGLLPLDSPLHEFAQTQLVDYQPQLLTAEQQLQKEEKARTALEIAQEAAQLAQVRQGVAQNLENWQFARVTWLVALNRLKQVGEGTLAAAEAEQLMAFYQTSLDDVNGQVSREKVASTSLEKAEHHAQIATAAERRHDWQQAIADWHSAIQYTQQIDSSSTYSLKAEGLLTQYQDAVAQVQENLKAKVLVEGELKQSCLGELQLCHIISIGQSIKLQLDESYMDAIRTARGNGNYNVQAVVTDHQLMVRQSLDRISNKFDLPIEVYTPDGGLLERHIPKPK